MKIISHNLDQKEDDSGLVLETSRGMHAAMAPGANLDQMNKSMLSIMRDYFDELSQRQEGTASLDQFLHPGT